MLLSPFYLPFFSSAFDEPMNRVFPVCGGEKVDASLIVQLTPRHECVDTLLPSRVHPHTLLSRLRAARPISETQSMELSSLARLTHSRHFDTVKHGKEGLTVPAGLILALATSLSARDLHEVRDIYIRTTAVRSHFYFCAVAAVPDGALATLTCC